MLQLVENGMPTKYLDEEGLSHVVDLAKKKFADKKELWNWQKTEKAGAVAFTPVPDSVLEPVVEFKFKETLPAEGEKSPSNPSTIEGIDSISVTHIGRNIAYAAGGLYRFSAEGDGYYTATVDNTNGTQQLSARIRYLANADLSWLDRNKNYCCVVEYENCTDCVVASVSQTEDIPFLRKKGGGYISISGTGIIKEDLEVYEANHPDNLLRAGANIPIGVNGNYKLRIAVFQCTAAEIDLDTYQYENPYANYTVNLNGTYYGGTLNVATGILTLNWEKLVLTGSGIDWIQGTPKTNSVQFYVNSNLCSNRINRELSVCTHFNYVTHSADDEVGFGFYSGDSTGGYFKYPDTTATIADFNQYLSNQYNAGTPVTVIYNINPIEIQLDPIQIKSLASLDKYEPRINTIYTDAESVQVGYQKFTAEGNFVHTTGNEVIEGIKTFKNARPGSNPNNTGTEMVIRNPEVERGTLRNGGSGYTRIIFADNEGDTEGDYSGRLGMIEHRSPATGGLANPSFALECYKFTSNPEEYANYASVTIGYDTNGIPYATAPETSDSRSTATDIATRGWIDKGTWNWKKTEKAQIVAFKPAPNSLIEPIVDFKFKETLPVEGEKGPSNPSTIAGVSQFVVGRYGANILRYPYYTNTNGGNKVETISWEPKEDGTVRLVINNPDVGAFYYINQFPGNTVNGVYAYRLPVGRYKVSLKVISGTMPDTAGAYLYMSHYSGFDGQTAKIVNTQYNRAETFAVTDPLQRHLFIVKAAGSYTADVVVRPVLCVASVDSDDVIEEYGGNEYTIQLGDTYYAGSVNLTTGLMKVTYASLALNGTETYKAPTLSEPVAGLYEVMQAIPEFSSDFICTHFQYASLIETTVDSFRAYSSGNVLFHVDDTTYPSLEDFISFVEEQHANGTPITLTYKLNSPIEVQLAPNQIESLAFDKYVPQYNTVYTNAESIQVGYPKYADDGNAVHRTGDETINGIKTFKNTASGHASGETVTDLVIRNEAVHRGISGEGRSYTRVIFADSEGDTEETFAGRLGFWECVSPKENDTINSYIQMGCYKYTNTTADLWRHADMRVGWDVNGIPFSSVPEISDERNDPADVVTRGWRISEDEIDELSIS